MLFNKTGVVFPKGGVMKEVTAETVQQALANVRRSKVFKEAEKNPELRKKGYRKLSYGQFIANPKGSGKTYVGAQIKVWNLMGAELQRSGLSKTLLKEPTVGSVIYNDLFIEEGSFAKKYAAELEAAKNAKEAPAAEEVRAEEAKAEEVAANAEGLTTEEPKAEENTAESATAAAPQAAEEVKANDDILNNPQFWAFVSAGNVGITQAMYRDNPAAYSDRISEMYNNWKEQQQQNGGEEQGLAEQPTAESGELSFTEDPQAAQENWIEEYNTYLTEYGEKHGDTWTCDNKVGSLDGHFTKGLSFNYSAPDHLSFGYKEGEKPEPQDFYGVLSLAKEKKQALNWGGNISPASREAIMQACADLGVNIVGLSAEEQQKFEALRNAKGNEEEKTSAEQTAGSKREKAMAAIAEMRGRIRGGADSAEMRGALLENAEGLGLNSEQVAKASRRKDIYELRQQGATTYGDDEASKKLLNLEIADNEARVAEAQTNPELGSKHAEARLQNLLAIRDGGEGKEQAVIAEKNRDAAVQAAHQQATARYQN